MSPEQIAQYLGLTSTTSQTGKCMFQLPQHDFWSRRFPLTQDVKLSVNVNKHLQNKDQKIIANLYHLYKCIFPQIQARWPRLPYFLHIYAARWLCKNREEVLKKLVEQHKPFQTESDTEVKIPTYPELYTKFQSDPFLTMNLQNQRSTNQLLNPPCYFDHMQLTKESYPLQLPQYCDTSLSHTYPLECKIAIPVNINDLIVTFWHTDTWSQDCHRLAELLMKYHFPQDRELKITSAMIKRSNGETTTYALPNSHDVLHCTVSISRRQGRSTPGTMERMKIYFSNYWPAKDLKWQRYLMYNLNIYHNLAIPFNISINNRQTAKQLELIIKIARDYPHFVPLFVISFLLDALEFSTDVIFWMILQPHAGLMTSDARWAQIKYLFPLRERNAPLPAAVQVDQIKNSRGTLEPTLFPPLEEDAIRHILCFYNFDDRIITALVDTAKNMITVSAWRLAFEAQKRQQARFMELRSRQTEIPLPVSSELLPTHSTYVPTMEHIEQFTPAWTDPISSHPPVHTTTREQQDLTTPNVHQARTISNAPLTYPSTDTVDLNTDDSNQETTHMDIIAPVNERVHEEASSPYSNALHERPSSPSTPPYYMTSNDPESLQHAPHPVTHSSSERHLEPTHRRNPTTATTSLDTSAESEAQQRNRQQSRLIRLAEQEKKQRLQLNQTVMLRQQIEKELQPPSKRRKKL